MKDRSLKALVLAGGYGTRLYPLTRNLPKALLEVGGRPVISYLLDQLQQIAAIEEILLITNARFYPLFQDWVLRHPCQKPLRLLNNGTYYPETRLGAGGDLAFAIREAGLKGDLLISSSDNLFVFDLQDLIDFFWRKGANVLCYYVEEDIRALQRTGVVEVNGQGRVLNLEEKPERPRSHLAVPALYIFEGATLPRVGDYLESGGHPDSLGCLVAWLCRRVPFYAYPIPGRRLSIGDMESYREACDYFARRGDSDAVSQTSSLAGGLSGGGGDSAATPESIDSGESIGLLSTRGRGGCLLLQV